jgi:hypothetical protein
VPYVIDGDVHVANADGTGRPALFIAHAESPAVVWRSKHADTRDPGHRCAAAQLPARRTVLHHMRTTSALAIVLALLLAPDAFAATASVHTYDQPLSSSATGLFYTAAAGETNRVVATADQTTQYFYDIVLRDTGAVVTAGLGCRSLDEHTVRCASAAPSLTAQTSRPELGMIIDVADGDDTVTTPASYVSRVYVLGGAGNDVLSGAGSLFGGAGNDTLTGGDDVPGYKGSGPPNDLLAGGPGDDVLHAGNGDDTLSGDGDAVLSSAAIPSLGPDSGGGNDVVDGGPGEFDRVSYEARTRGVRVDLVDTVGFDGAPGERDKLSGVENVIGGSADDVLIGNEVRNNLEGGAGNDRLLGGAGWDILAGGYGNDVIDGGIGSDHIYGGPGMDIVRGGAGEDDIQARGDGAAIDGGPGSDNFIIGHPRSLRCGSGNYDTVFKPRGLLLSDCESVEVGASGYPAYYDTAKVNVRPRRGRTGGLRFPWLCKATANRCDMRVTVRQRSALVGRRSAVLFKRDADGVIVVAPHKTIRRGSLLDVSISGAVYEANPPGGQTQRVTASWRIRL